MSNEAMVKLVGVKKDFGKQAVLHGVDFSLFPGQITGLLGPSGCGKTTLVNIIVGMLRADGGTVQVLGSKPPFFDVRPQMGFMPQSEALYNDLTANENLHFFGSLYGMKKKVLEEAIPHTLELVHLDDQKRKTVSSFSGGMKRRLSLAIALLHSPKLLVLDEPTVGLDPVHRIELWESFRLLAEAGSCLLITTHVMSEAINCDSIIMIHDGSKIAEGSPEDLMRQTDVNSLDEVFLAFEHQALEEGSSDAQHASHS